MQQSSISISNVEFLEDLKAELNNVLNYWSSKAPDKANGGFIGKIDGLNVPHNKTPKGIILNTRLLWTFSRANNHFSSSKYDKECDRAYTYLKGYFKDELHGGLYWEVDYQGNPTSKRKQVYAQAFGIYALAEYYKYSKNSEAYRWAFHLYELLEEIAYDKKEDGYFEAFDSNWNPIDDMRLSEKDLNAPKTTNTLLHVLEAYTTLYEISNSSQVKESLTKLIKLFSNAIFQKNNHLKLFFFKDWKSLNNEISYGHDIEAAWLIAYAAEMIDNPELIKSTREQLISVTDTFLKEALDHNFGVINSKDLDTNHIDTDLHWWPQVEALVALIHCWKTTKDNNYLSIAKQIWETTKKRLIDHINGGWFFRVDADGHPYLEENKIGPWKCPYHNGRALMEVTEVLAMEINGNS